MALCANCRDFDIQAFNASNRFTQSYELSLLAIAASEGCPWCKFVYANKPSHLGVVGEEPWVHFWMVGAGSVWGGKGSDELILEAGMSKKGGGNLGGRGGKGKGKEKEREIGKAFTRCKVWVGSKKATTLGGRTNREFRLWSEPGECVSFLYEGICRRGAYVSRQCGGTEW